MNDKELKVLKKHAVFCRKRLLEMIYQGKNGHTGGSLSSVDILVSLYFSIMKIDPQNPKDPDRDRFIMSKGHSVEALYSVLSGRGFFEDEILDSYGRFQSPLAGHPLRKIPGIELNSGALGHGLSVGVGMALAAKRSGQAYRTFVLMGDGEQAEGSLMEASATAGHYRLDNLVGIIDRNGLQISGPTGSVMEIEDLSMKYRACNWEVKECDGNDVYEITTQLDNLPFRKDAPSLLIAHTIKGKGITFIENNASWHHKVPSEEEFNRAVSELDKTLEEI
jgi:transketolase